MIAWRQDGFTLLELLIAIAIFALIAVMAYGGLDTVIRHSSIIRADTAEVLAAQRGLRLLRQDLQFAVDRPVRDALGGQVPAFVSGQGRLFGVTRMGMVNPWMAPRSQLARVAWRLDGDRLERAVLAPVDGQVDSTTRAPRWRVELRRVGAVQATFYDDKNQAYPTWPPPNAPDAGLPRAVELRLTLDRMPPIRITVALASDWPATAAGTSPTTTAAPPPRVGRDQESVR